MAAAALATETGATGGKRPEPPSLERLAAAFPQLEVIEFIGQGGMGAVYKVRQKQLDRIVALKVLPPGIGGDPSFAERFTREAKALAKLLHPNIVALFEFGQADGIYYLLMEYVDGVSLGQLLRSSRVSPREALAIVPQICDALQYAHDQGIVHRDIKPENILLDRRGRVKVADFGLAKLVEANAPLTPSLSPSDGERVADRPGERKTPALTDAGKIMGTPAYMAPEQAEHPGEVDHRADIYALGVVFYQMLTGELPGKRIEAPSKKVQIDVRLDEVVLRALEKKPELRYQQVSEVKTMVETIVATPSASSRREEAQNESGKATERRVAPMVKSERARLTVQEFAGARVNYPAMGEVTLYTDRLVISSGHNQRAIPLADIHELGEAVMPFWESPGPHFFAAVDFDEAGQRRRLVFLAGSSIIRTPRDTRLHAAEWLTAIQRAMKSGIGRDLPIADGPTVVPVRIWRSLMWLLVWGMAAAIPLIANLLSKRGPGSFSVMNSALMSGAFMLIPALTLFIVYVVRSCLLRGTVKRPLGCVTGNASNSLGNAPPGTTPDEARGTRVLSEPRFSRTAIVGVGFGILGVLALVVYAVIGDSNLLDEVPSNVLAAFTALCLLVSAILGWVAVSQIRRSARRLHGTWLAVFDGLLFPLLALNGLIAVQTSTMVQTFSAIDAVVTQLGIQPVSGERFKWLAGMATVFMCVVINTLIAWGVWRAVNKRRAGVPPADSEESTFGKWACGPLVVVTLGPALLMTVGPWQEGLAVGLTAAICSVALALALVWGLMSWRRRLGKFVIIATGVLFVALIVAAAVHSFVILPAKRARLQAAFGPVTECTLPMDEDGRTPLFDLDHNRPVFNPKPGDTAGDMGQRLAQLKKPGVAIHHDGQTHVVAVSGMTIRRIDGDPWEIITDTDMDNLGAFLSSGVTAPGSWQTGDFPGKLPHTIFFKTGVTKLGLLQVTGFTENPRGVKLRYKLVRDGKPNTAPAAAQTLSFGPLGAGFVGLVACGLTALYFALRKRRRTESAGVPPAEPRFSRTAIVGVCFGVLALVLVALADIVDSVTPYELASMALAALGALCLLTSTILGCVAVSQIRRSEGKLHGMWLAVFGGLLFPLLLLDGAIAAFILNLRLALNILWRNNDAPLNSLFIVLACILLAAVDYLIIRRVWPAVNQSGTASTQSVQKSQRLWPLVVIVFVVIPMLCLLGDLAVVHYLRELHQARALHLQHTGTNSTSAFGPELERGIETARILGLNSNYTFGPVIERELSGSESLSNSFLDLDTGRVLSAPEELVERLRSEGKLNGGSPSVDLLRDWMRNSGADVVKRTGKQWSLVQLDGVCQMLADEAGNRDPPEAFDTVSVERVMRALKTAEEESGGLTPVNPVARLSSRGDGLFAFKTREGGMGVLQVLGESNNQRSVKLRYKLVQARKDERKYW
jgi:predicted Ser/Thr protein kinase